jgi:hypothetical protein
MAFLKSARSVETVTDAGYHRCDHGLYLQVTKRGTKSWLFRYKSPLTAKQREMGLAPLTLPVWAVEPWFGIGFHSAQLSSVYGVLLYPTWEGFTRHA